MTAVASGGGSTAQRKAVRVDLTAAHSTESRPSSDAWVTRQGDGHKPSDRHAERPLYAPEISVEELDLGGELPTTSATVQQLST